MATIHMDNAQIYGTTPSLLDGMYADAPNANLGVVANLSCFQFNPLVNTDCYIRKILPTTKTTLLVAGRVRMSQLPSVNLNSPRLRIVDVLNTAIATLWVDTTGRIVICQGEAGGTEVARSAAPILVANTWQFIECKFVIGAAGAGSVEVRVNDSSVGVIVAPGVTIGTVSNPIAQVTYGARSGEISSYWTDVHIWDTVGTRNIDFLGDVAITTLWPNQDVQTGWTPNPRKKLGTGILQNRTYDQNNQPSGLSTPDSASLRLGSSDYTIETFLRWDKLPTSANRVTILGKWYEPTDQRSYELSKCGPSLNGGNLEFRISTGGTAGTVRTLFSIPWSPETNRWYHLAVVRSSGQTMFFIDGIMYNVPQTDGVAYFDSTDFLTIGVNLYQYSVDHRTNPNTSLMGWFDETRISRIARYLVNFAPTTIPFGRDSGGDPQFANVALLLGYDNQSLSDESSYSRTMSSIASPGFGGICIPIVVDDGYFQFQTINQEDTLIPGPPRDDTNISASFYFANAVLTLTSNPLNADTITINARVYTFKTVLAAAYDVLIGANIQASLANLAAAINQDVGSGTLYGAGTAVNTDVVAGQLPSPQMQVTALIAGTTGNAITVAKSGAGSWSAANLTGGANIPGPSSFRLTRLPAGVTSVRSVMAVTRAYKTEAGPATMKTNFVGPAGAIVLGSTRSLPTEAQYGTEVFETDPDTTGVITPSTLLQGRIQFDRIT